MTTAHLLLLAAGLLAQPPADLPPFITKNVQTVTFYYKSPDASLGSKLLAELLKKENIEHPWFAKNQVLPLIAAQLGDIAIAQPEQVRKYEAAFAAASPAGRRVILRALRSCGDQKTVAQIDAWLADKGTADVKADLEALKKHLQDPQRKHVRDVAPREPKDLDLLWSNFFITGEYEPVSRILDVFDLPDAKENEVMKRVARWSLGSNLQQHPRLAELVMKHTAERPPGSRKVIDETILKLPKEEKK